MIMSSYRTYSVKAGRYINDPDLDKQELRRTQNELDKIQYIRQYLENHGLATLTAVRHREDRYRRHYWMLKRQLEDDFQIAGVPNGR